MLNSLCAAGLRLSQSLNTLSQAQNTALATQNMFSWDELAKSTVVASHTVKTHIAAAMQDLCIGETFTESDALRQQEHNQQIITENLLTFINLQYQFSIAGCECLGAMAMCPCCQTMAGGLHDPDCSMANLQQCFARLYTHDSRSQMSSPHMDSPKMGEVPKSEYSRHSPMSTSASMDRPPERGNSPFHEPRGPSPIYSLPAGIEGIRGPLPNPGQLLTMKGPFPGRGLRSPLHFPLFPLTGQRRWSEAAAGEVSAEGGDGTMRRWSMPWDCGRVETPWQQRYLPSKLAVPPGTSQERSRSTTPGKNLQIYKIKIHVCLVAYQNAYRHLARYQAKDYPKLSSYSPVARHDVFSHKMPPTVGCGQRVTMIALTNDTLDRYSAGRGNPWTCRTLAECLSPNTTISFRRECR